MKTKRMDRVWMVQLQIQTVDGLLCGWHTTQMIHFISPALSRCVRVYVVAAVVVVVDAPRLSTCVICHDFSGKKYSKKTCVSEKQKRQKTGQVGENA